MERISEEWHRALGHVSVKEIEEMDELDQREELKMQRNHQTSNLVVGTASKEGADVALSHLCNDQDPQPFSGGFMWAQLDQ